MAKRVKGVYKGHTFLVVNKWFGGLKLYHNSQLLEHNKDMYALNKEKPLISRYVSIDSKQTLLEVYAYAITRVRIQIRINGVMIAGDKF